MVGTARPRNLDLGWAECSLRPHTSSASHLQGTLGTVLTRLGISEQFKSDLHDVTIISWLRIRNSWSFYNDRCKSGLS